MTPIGQYLQHAVDHMCLLHPPNRMALGSRPAFRISIGNTKMQAQQVSRIQIHSQHRFTPAAQYISQHGRETRCTSTPTQSGDSDKGDGFHCWSFLLQLFHSDNSGHCSSALSHSLMAAIST